ncbi:MAG: hypothetical protein JNG88_12595 [Phycisphaerales bacterium]|nr:hypothetical protein [Phycisphaerales bacterium]
MRTTPPPLLAFPDDTSKHPLRSYRSPLESMCFLALSLFCVPEVFAQPCNIEDINNPAFLSSSAMAVSSDGSVVVGQAFGPLGPSAFRWAAEGGMQSLGTLPDGFDSIALDVSNDGNTVVGWAINSTGQFRAFRWTPSTGMQDIGSFSDTGTELAMAYAVSSDGSIVVGWASHVDGYSEAFRWTQGGNMQRLGTLGGTGSQAFDCSADGSVIIGISADANENPRGFLWTARAGMQDIGGIQPTPYAVSGDGRVIVGADNGAFRWTFDEGIHNIGLIGQSMALDCSFDGSIIVGQTFDDAGYLRSFRWESSGETQLLCTLGGTETSASGLSANGGVAVGTSAIDGDQTSHAFRWEYERLIEAIDTNDPQNERGHHTHQYALSTVPINQERTILRRGFKPPYNEGTADFDILVTQHFNPAAHRISFEALHTFNGAPPFLPTIISIPGYAGTVPAGEWGHLLLGIDASGGGGWRVRTRIVVPPSAAIGEYTFRAVVEDATNSRLAVADFPTPVVILFNPWDSRDDVYDPDAMEYVMGDKGAWWNWNRGEYSYHPWSYNQFTENVFLTSLDFLIGLDEEARKSPVDVVRRVCERTNQRNDDGMLIDCWRSFGCTGVFKTQFAAEPYFREFRHTGQPVPYGQCSMFAGCCVSALRALGIPSRTVSVLAAGIDKDVPPNGEVEFEFCGVQMGDRVETIPAMPRNVEQHHPDCIIDYSDYEFIWNYHVWGEAYFRRTALGPEYGGWQAFDPSPMQLRNDEYQSITGPASLLAVRDGTQTPFDSSYVLSQVDADAVEYLRSASGRVETPGRRDSTSVGREIITKAVGDNAEEYISVLESYKDREALPVNDDVTLNAPQVVSVGSDLQLELRLENRTTSPATYRWNLLPVAISERGDPLVGLAEFSYGALTAHPDETVFHSIAVSSEDISRYANELRFVQAVLTIRREEDGRIWSFRPVVMVDAVPLSVDLAPLVHAHPGVSIDATISVRNTFPYPLDSTVISLRATGAVELDIGAEKTVELPTLEPGAEYWYQTTLYIAGLGLGQMSVEVGRGTRLFGDYSTSLRSFLLADMNCDDMINGFDIDPFVTGLVDPAAYALSYSSCNRMNGDVNGDGLFDNFDIDSFIECVVEGACNVE